MPYLSPSDRDGSAVRTAPRTNRLGALACAVFLVLGATTGTGIAQGSGLRPMQPPSGLQEAEVLAPSDRLSGAGAAQDETGLGQAFVEVASARATGFVGELLAIEVRFGLDAEFLSSNVIPLFRRHLDVPVQLAADWLDEGDALELASAFVAVPPEDAVTIARNDRLAHARRLPDRGINGRTFRVFALDVRRIERAPGTLRLASPRLVYARASAFTDDFVNGRTPTERRDAYVVGRDLAIEIAPLPEEGRPADFSGAVGEFQLDARIESDPIASSARFVLELHGDGDLGSAHVPGASEFPGFRVLGVLDDHGRARRTVAYDLVPDGAGVRRVGEVRFQVFDPRPPGHYVALATPALELSALVVPEQPVAYPPAGLEVYSSMLVLLATILLAAVAIAALVAVLVRRSQRK